MDDVDIATELNDQHIAASLAEHRRRNPPASLGSAPTFDKGGLGGICEDCGDPIPEGRRTAMPHCTRCVDCQTTLENWRPL